MTIMEEHVVKILEIHDVTHNVKCFRIEKPAGYSFIPGQATEVSINNEKWKDEKRPFTFTCLQEDPYLEFTIKRYADHDGVTNNIHQLKAGDELIIRDVWGAIAYAGPGYFIAGGAGITPFIAILRRLNKDGKIAGNALLFANKTSSDIIYETELSAMKGLNFINILSDQPSEGEGSKHLYGRIDEAFLKKEIKDFSVHFYVCGPDKMISDINTILSNSGAKPESVVFEK